MSNEELSMVKGGLSKTVLFGTIGLAITFIIGLVDGFMRPLSCNS